MEQEERGEREGREERGRGERREGGERGEGVHLSHSVGCLQPPCLWGDLLLPTAGGEGGEGGERGEREGRGERESISPTLWVVYSLPVCGVNYYSSTTQSVVSVNTVVQRPGSRQYCGQLQYARNAVLIPTGVT